MMWQRKTTHFQPDADSMASLLSMDDMKNTMAKDS